MNKIVTIFLLFPFCLHAQMLFIRMNATDNFGVGYYNNFIPGPPGRPDTTKALYDFITTKTTVRVAFSVQGTPFDNGFKYKPFQLWPDTIVLRKGVYYQGAVTITLLGLDDSSLYAVSFFGSRDRTDGQGNVVAFGTQSIGTITDGNVDKFAQFYKLAPSKGKITFTLRPGKAYTYLNLLTIDGVQKHGPVHAVITADSTTINSPNSIIRLSTDSSKGGPLNEAWAQMAGPTVALFTGVGTHTWISGLFPGSYRFRVFLTDTLGRYDSAFVTIKVNAPKLPPCPVCVVCPAPRTVVGMTLQLINGVLVPKFTYSDGKP